MSKVKDTDISICKQATWDLLVMSIYYNQIRNVIKDCQSKEKQSSVTILNPSKFILIRFD